MRIGLFGGSFNPPHLGHTALARVASAHLGLDELRWLPAGMPWQKPAGELAPAAHRAAMVSLAIEGEIPGGSALWRLDEREIHRVGPSYTRDTVAELRQENPSAQLFLILGQDQYARIDTWRDIERWRDQVHFAVAARDGKDPQPPAAWGSHAPHCHVLPLPPQPLSATAIRQRIAQGQPLDGLVKPGVARYIAQHHLYRLP